MTSIPVKATPFDYTIDYHYILNRMIDYGIIARDLSGIDDNWINSTIAVFHWSVNGSEVHLGPYYPFSYENEGNPNTFFYIPFFQGNLILIPTRDEFRPYSNLVIYTNDIFDVSYSNSGQWGTTPADYTRKDLYEAPFDITEVLDNFRTVSGVLMYGHNLNDVSLSCNGGGDYPQCGNGFMIDTTSNPDYETIFIDYTDILNEFYQYNNISITLKKLENQTIIFNIDESLVEPVIKPVSSIIIYDANNDIEEGTYYVGDGGVKQFNKLVYNYSRDGAVTIDGKIGGILLAPNAEVYFNDAPECTGWIIADVVDFYGVQHYINAYLGDEDFDVFLEEKVLVDENTPPEIIAQENNIHQTIDDVEYDVRTPLIDEINSYKIEKYDSTSQDWTPILTVRNNKERIHTTIPKNYFNEGWTVFKISQDNSYNNAFSTLGNVKYLFIYSQKDATGNIYYYHDNVYYFESEQAYLNITSIADIQDATQNLQEDIIISDWGSLKNIKTPTFIVKSLVSHDIQVIKKVYGDMIDTQKEYSFTISFSDGNIPNLSLEYDNSTDMYNYDFTLEANESIEFQDIPEGTKFSLVENDADGITVIYELNSYPVNNISLVTLDEDIGITIKNSLSESPPTGVSINIYLYILMTAISICLITLTLKMKGERK